MPLLLEFFLDSNRLLLMESVKVREWKSPSAEFEQFERAAPDNSCGAVTNCQNGFNKCNLSWSQKANREVYGAGRVKLYYCLLWMSARQTEAAANIRSCFATFSFSSFFDHFDVFSSLMKVNGKLSLPFSLIDSDGETFRSKAILDSLHLEKSNRSPFSVSQTIKSWFNWRCGRNA